jgi:hypothetical protein
MGWYIALAVAAAIVWIWRRGMRPHPFELSYPGAIASLLRFLMVRGVYKSGIVGTATVCDRDHPEHCLVFSKYIRDAQPGVRAEFPRVSWSEPYFDSFRTELVRRGVPHQELVQPSGPTLAFDFGRDLGGAHVVTHVLFEDVLGRRVARDCVAYLRDTVDVDSPRWTGVDAPYVP